MILQRIDIKVNTLSLSFNKMPCAKKSMYKGYEKIRMKKFSYEN